MPRLIRMLPFIGVLSVLLYITNLIVYEALAAAFLITASWQLLVLGTALGVLSASFIVATILGMRFYNIFTRSYYSLSAVWIGFFLYLLLASIVYALFAVLPGTSAHGIGEIFFAVAIMVGVYALAHARKIYAAQVEISLQHLPEAWRGRKAVWVSDLHLGQLHGPSFARSVLEKVNALAPDIVFIGGDLFDGTGAPDPGELIAALKELNAPLGTYFITGNHEEFGDNSKFISAVKAAGMNVLQDEMTEIDGVQLIGVDYHNASDTERFRTILSKLSIDARKPSILLKHEPNDLAIAQAAGVSVQISGHTHRAQMWPLGYLAQWRYKGYAYGLKRFKEMQVYTSSGVGTWGPPLRFGTNSEAVVFTFVDEK